MGILINTSSLTVYGIAVYKGEQMTCSSLSTVSKFEVFTIIESYANLSIEDEFKDVLEGACLVRKRSHVVLKCV